MPLIINPPFKTSDSGLVLYMPLWAGELSLSSFNSRDINKHLCTVTGATWELRGRKFDGTDDLIEIANTILDPTVRTVICWFKVNAIPYAGILLNKESSWRPILASDVSDTKLSCRYATTDTAWAAGTMTGNTTLVANTWYMGGFTYDLSTMTLYLNGQADGTKSETGEFLTNATVLTIGRNGTAGSLFLAGNVGEVYLYNRVLSAAEITNIYLATKWRYS